MVSYDYRAHYDADAEEVVRRHFAEDLVRFGYAFDVE